MVSGEKQQEVGGPGGNVTYEGTDWDNEMQRKRERYNGTERCAYYEEYSGASGRCV
mgnify:CR=1 FL=1